uniref:General secretion pathway protein H n=1 Tax=uncultured bacterium UPO42 TaxID=1776967 RepID=A0A126SZP1_9BACT|nr:general secretion pathway protein H [uncultured bacterium UPO42]
MWPSFPPPSRAVAQAGFTLVELITVLVVLGILGGVIATRFNFSGFNEAGFRDKLTATLAFARKSAVAQRRNVCVTLAANRLELRIDNVPTGAAGAGTCPRVLDLPVSDTACGGLSYAVCAPNGVALAGPAGLSFDPLGRPSLTPSAQYTVSGGTSGYIVTVEAETGYVH